MWPPSAGVIHYYMQVKADVRQPLVFAAVLAILLGYRLDGLLAAPQARAGGNPANVKPKTEA